MRLLLRSAARVWTRRPAGPIIVALGLLAATLLAGGADLAMSSATSAERNADELALGDEMARIRTPGGYTVGEDALVDLQQRIADDGKRSPAEERLPVYLGREGTVTANGDTTSGWRVLGLPAASIEAMGLPVPGDGAALVDPGSREQAPDQATVRVQAAPSEEVTVQEGFSGQLAQTVRVGDSYQHSEDDEYVFETNVTPGAKRLVLFVASADNSTDFDLEAESPSGQVWLDDNGTAQAPEQPRLEIGDPAGGTWTMRVHAKLARNEAFRLRAIEVFDARDAQVLGRLLEGEGFRAVGARLGLTQQAALDLDLQRSDLSTLGPDDGLIVLPLDRLQTRLDLDGEATGLIVRSAPGEDPLDGLDSAAIDRLETHIAQARENAQTPADPVQGLTLSTSSNDRAQERKARLASTSDLINVVLPAGVLAGVLLATWAAGLHARRMQNEITVLAGFGQRRSRSLLLSAMHLGPAIVLGVVAALAVSPFVGEAVAAGLGLTGAETALPDASTLLVPAIALVPIAATVVLTLREPMRGVDPGQQGAPPTKRRRWLIAAGLVAAGVGSAGLGLVLDNPSNAYLAYATAGALIGGGLIWAPLPELVLSKARSLRANMLGLFRTRSMHGPLALASATMALVFASLVAGVALSQAAQPDAASESGGYDVIAETPSFTQSYAEIRPSGEKGQQADRLTGQTLSTDFLMRVTGTGIHSADTGRLQTIYGIDTSFSQRHRHTVRSLDPGIDRPFNAVATSTDRAVVSSSVHQALTGDTIEIRGPGGTLTYDVVGVVETRLVEGVYIAKNALPSQFTQIAGEQRIRIPDDIDSEAYAQDLQSAFRDQALTAASSQQLVDRRLDGQQRAGTTLSAMAGLGVVTALGLVVLIGIRARAERRLSDTVLSALGAKPSALAAGIATETAIPVLVGFTAGTLASVPIAYLLGELSGLAFPLTPIDQGNLVTTALVVLAGLVVLALAVSGAIAYSARGELDQATIRE